MEPWSKIREKELRDPDFAREYLLAAVEEGLDLNVALGDVVRAVGTRKYARWLKGIDQPNVLRALRKGSNPTIKTIEKILAPLRLRLSVQEG
jgi:DNA-binding phage protein